MRALLVVLAVGVCAGVAWGNGDVIRYDPKSGVILPGEPTPAVIERETLTIEFVPQEGYPQNVSRAEVRAEYAVANPTDKPLALEIGFPISGGSLLFYEAPVLLDGKPIEWRLLDYEELIRPMMPSLVKSVRTWQKRHPKAVALAAQMHSLREQQPPPADRREQEEVLWREFRAELVKAGTKSPNRSAAEALRPDLLQDLGKPYQSWGEDLWLVRKHLRETGQRALLPEGSWHVSDTIVDPATGRETRPPYADSHSPGVSMLTFSVHLDANRTHALAVRYREAPGGNEEWGLDGGAYQLQYILRTTGGWASFGPIDVTVKAPPGLVFRSLPKLRYIGPSKGQKVYQATLRDPERNLQIALARPEVLLPRLKVNGELKGQRYDMLVGGVPFVPALELPGVTRRILGGTVILDGNSVTVRVKPGEKHMVVGGREVLLTTPVTVRNGNACLPVEVVRALYPDSEVALSYHEGSRTVLLSIKPRR